MHILVLPSFYPSRVRPLAGIFFKEQAEALQRAGHKVGVLVAPRIRETLDYIKSDRGLPSLHTITVEGTPEVPVYRMHWGWFPRIFPLITAGLHTSAVWSAFQKYCDEQGKPDIIHTHNVFYSGLMSSKLREKYKIPVVLTEHSTNFLNGRVFLPGQHAVARYTLRHIDQALAVSAKLSDVLQKYAPKNPAQFIGNVVDTDFFSSEPLNENAPFTFAVAVITLISRKRIDLLVDAFNLAFKGQNIRLKIAGNSGKRSIYEAQVEKLGIASQVEFVGGLSREGVRDLFHKAHVIVSSSDIETFGVTLIEAMACGKPVIATRSGGPEGFVNEGNGLLVPVGDVQAMAEAMQRMVNTYSQYDSRHIRDECVARFSESAIVRQLEAIYASVLQG